MIMKLKACYFFCLLYFVADMQLTMVAAQCPNNNWFHYEEKEVCIMAETVSTKSWGSAQQACQNHPDGAANLIKIENSGKKDIVKHYTQISIQNYWIGLNDIDQEGTFEWTDGTPLSDYTNWFVTQPSHGTNQDCVEIWTWLSGFWNDADCYSTKAYLCEMPAACDPCESNPCLNGGTCEAIPETCTDYICSCPGCWFGPNCNEAMDPCEYHSCQNSATCLPVPCTDEYPCVCEYQCLCDECSTGELCDITMDPCEHHSCQNYATCLPLPSSCTDYQCLCDECWAGELCDISDCVLP